MSPKRSRWISLFAPVIAAASLLLAADARAGGVGFKRVDSSLGTVAPLVPTAVATADFDRDGKPDLAVASSQNHNVTIALGDGNGHFTPFQTYGFSGPIVSIAVGDFNRDGRVDLVVADPANNTVDILFGNGDGTFTIGPSFPVDRAPAAVIAADLNNDGILDIAASAAGANDISILIGNGDGTFSAHRDNPAHLHPFGLAAADLDGDHLLDLVATNVDSADVAVFLGRGDGTFQTKHTFDVGRQPTSVAVADFNRDGRSDLAITNSADNSVSILLGDGQGGFSPGATLSAGTTPYWVAVSDFNSDGIPDLAVANSGSNDVSVLLGNGDGTFQAAVAFPVGNSPQYLIGFDINLDHRPDIAVADSGATSVTSLINGALAPTSGTGTQADETLPGFKGGNVLDATGLDNVNVLSGDDGLVIPLGPTYTLGPTFRWQLAAHNTLKFWYMTDYLNCSPSATGGQAEAAYVMGFPTLGVGWSLHLGYANTTAYVAPDGATHWVDLTTSQTSDNSRLRVTCVTGSCEVDFPDGMKHLFTQPFSTPTPTAGASPDFQMGDSGTGYLLTSIVDPFGTTVLSVHYLPAVAGISEPWQIDYISLPTLGSQKIQFAYQSWSYTSGPSWPVLSTLTFPTGPGSLTESVAVDFMSPVAFTRNSFDTTQVACTNPTPAQVYVPILQDMIFKQTDSAQTVTTLATYGFTSSTAGTNFMNGALTKITLPTGGSINYGLGVSNGRLECSSAPTDLETSDQPTACTYSQAPFVGGFCHICSSLDHSPSVITRTLQDVGGGTLATTSYWRRTIIPNGFPYPTTGVGWNTRLVEVTRGTGGANPTMTRYLFHQKNRDGIDPGTYPTLGEFELARFTYDGAIDSNHIITGTLVRSAVECHDMTTTAGATTNECGYLASGTSVNTWISAGSQRSTGTVTWFGAKPSTASGGACPTSGSTVPCRASITSGWDPTAQQYSVTTESNAHFANPTPTRTVTFHFTPFINLADQTHSSHWFLNLWDTKTSADATQTIQEGAEYDVDTTNLVGTGFLVGRWTFNPDTTSLPALLLTCRYKDAAGNVTNDFSATYDHSDIPSFPSNVCSTTYPSFPTNNAVGNNSDAFGHHYSWTSGRLNNTSWIQSLTGNPTHTLSWFDFKVVRDSKTGLITQSADTAGVTTGYSYDALGRLTAISPSGETATSISYDSTTQTTVTRNGGAGLTTYQQFLYDDVGRLSREIRQLPNNAGGSSNYSVRVHSYDSGGHDFFTSEWLACTSVSNCGSLAVTAGTCSTSTTGQGTTRCGYDPFDRPTFEIRADGSTTKVDRTDGSISFSDTKEKVTVYSDTAQTVVADGPTTTFKDPFDRVASVTDALSNSTTYSWNLVGKLTGVNQGGQTRSFAYDIFGFLKSDTNPESAQTTYPSPDGSISPYGALGNVRSMSQNGVPYTYSYDAAGRLTTVTAKEGIYTRTYLSNTYDQTQTGTYPLGKLTTRAGANFYASTTQASDSTVTQTFTYAGVGGRLSSETTSVTGAPGGTKTYTQSWTYNTLGLITNRTHPYSGLSEGISYSYGLPTSVTGGGASTASSIYYNPAAQISSWSAFNGVKTTIAQDPNLFPRPLRITSTSGTTPLFDTGNYSYDGAGNIIQIGQDIYGYDAASRLTSYNLAAIGTKVSGASGSYQYDQFGNLTSGLPANVGVDSTTNRLATIDPHIEASVSYDNLGNLTTLKNTGFTYDALSRRTTLFRSSTNGGGNEQYIYDGAGERIARIRLTSPNGRDAQFVSQSIPLQMTASGTYSVTITMKNIGSTTWSGSDPNYPVKLGLAPGMTDSWGVTRVLLGSTLVAPGSSFTFTFTVTAPTAPGFYDVNWQMVAENQEWFGDVSPIVHVNVVAASSGVLAQALKFYTIVPCRLADTRSTGASAAPIEGPIASGESLALQVAGACGVAANALAVSGNLTGINATGSGDYLTLFPGGEATLPLTSYLPPGKTRADNFVMGLSNGLVALAMQGGDLPVHALLDVNGYFLPSGLTPQESGVPATHFSRTQKTPPDWRPRRDREPQAVAAQTATWFMTLRDEANRLATELSISSAGTSTLQRDYFYLGAQLAGSRDGAGNFLAYAADHLGTPRLVTGAGGALVGIHKYLPYGEEFVDGQDGSSLRFAGMERDASTAQDYDHARVSLTQIARFASPDKIRGNAFHPLTWNRYRYASNNPLSRADVDGFADDYFSRAADLARSAYHHLKQAVFVRGGVSVGPEVKVKMGQAYVSAGGKVGVEAQFVPSANVAVKAEGGIAAGLQGSTKGVGVTGEVKATVLENGKVPEKIVEGSIKVVGKTAEGTETHASSDSELSVTASYGVASVEAGVNLSEAGAAASDFAQSILDALGGALNEASGGFLPGGPNDAQTNPCPQSTSECGPPTY